MKATNDYRRTLLAQRLVMIALIVSLAVSVSGVALAGNSPPTTINTCTKVNPHGVYGATKVTTGSNCKGTGYFDTWTPTATANAELATADGDIAALSAYKQLMIDSRSGSPTISYAGVNFSDMSLPSQGIDNGNFSGANFSGSGFFGVIGSLLPVTCGGACFGWSDDNFSNANFSDAVMGPGGNFSGDNFDGADLSGAFLLNDFLANDSFANTICPDGTNSNDDGGTCVNNL